MLTGTACCASKPSLDVQCSVALTRDRSCGPDTEFTHGLDPEFKTDYLKKLTQTLPSGLARTLETDRSYEDTDSDGAFDRITHTWTRNNRHSFQVHDLLSARKTAT